MSLGGKDVMRLVGELHVERQTASASSRRMVCSCVFEMAAMCMALLTAGCFRRAASLPFLAPRGWDAGAQAGSRRASRCTYTEIRKACRQTDERRFTVGQSLEPKVPRKTPFPSYTR